jgi:ABC-type glycerol-3-phosphate transport system substrate-binding protein
MSGGGATIRVSTSDDSEEAQAALEEIKSRFEEETDHTVEYEVAGTEGQYQQLARGVRAGNPPESAILSLDAGAQFLGDDVFIDVSEEYDRVQEQAGDILNSNYPLRAPGEDIVYGIPFEANAHNMSIHAGTIEELGFSVPEGATDRLNISWETGIEWARTLNQESDMEGWCLPYGTSPKASQDMLEFLWAHGVDVFTGSSPDDISITLHTGDNREKTLTAIEHAAEAISTGPQASGWGWGDVSQAFGTRSTGMVQYSIGRMLQSTRDSSPDFADQVVPINPPHTGSRSDGARITGSVVGMVGFKNSENPSAAAEFNEWFVRSGACLELILAVPFHYYPVYPNHSGSDRYVNNDIISGRPDLVEYQDEQAQYASQRTITADGAYNPLMGAAYSEGTLGNLAARVVVQDMTPEEALDATVPELEALREE